MLERRLTQEERDFCKFGVQNLEEYTEAVKNKVAGSQVLLVNSNGKFFCLIPPEVYLRCPCAYDNPLYFKRVKSMLNIRGKSITFRTEDFKVDHSPRSRNFLWCSIN